MTLITSFDPWKNTLCTCPAKYSLSPYTGCTHGCLYCYASSYIRDFSTAREKKDFLERLKREIKKIPAGAILTIANSSDPYQPLEKKLELTQNALCILRNYDLKINLVTKSALIVRDVEILKSLKNVVVSFTLTTLNEALSKKLEPGASLPAQRLAAMEELSKYLPVACRIDPLIYSLNTGEINTLVKEVKKRGAVQIITSTYKAKPDNFKRMRRAFPHHAQLWQNAYIAEGQQKGGCLYLPKEIRHNLIKEVREIVLKEGLYFSSCREGFESLNTKNCDGSSLFETNDYRD